MGLLRRIYNALFARTPYYHVSAYKPIYSAVVARLCRTGVTVGGTAGYPRVEVHSISESERLDKDGALRQLSLTVESISNKSMGEASEMNDDNLQLLTQEPLTIEGWHFVGIVPTLLQDITESSDTQTIIYRILQQFTLYVELVKPVPEPEPTPEPEPEPDPEPEPEETPAETPENDETQDTTEINNN